MSGLVGQVVKETYHFTEYIGRGGMAEVYKVWDSQRVIHLAAKVLHKDMALDKVFLRRFKREADTLTKLQHPHIIRSYGLQQEGRLAFLLMDFVEGESLKELIFDADGPLPTEQIRNILRPVTGALYYAHSQGFVHCDIKPANIMLDKYGEVRLADFGIARVTDAATATMVGAGTPAYMAPEQIKGQDPTPQTDIYALGIVLFEMLTGGERPFTGELAEITGSTGEKVRWEQIKSTPPSMKRWNPAITSQLDAVVQKCLAKDPADRYQNPLDVMNDFERAVGMSVQPPVEKTARKSKPVTPPPTPVQTTPPLPLSSQPKVSTEKPIAKQSVRQKKKFPVWSYVVGGFVLLSIVLLGVFGLGAVVLRPPAPTPTRIAATRTSKATKTPKPTIQPILATAHARKTATAFAAPIATQTAKALAQIADGPKDWNLFYDDFEDNRNDWETGNIENDWWEGSKEIGSTYKWNVDTIVKENFWFYSTAGQDLPEVYYVQVDAKLTKGSDENSCYGIVFGHKEDRSFRFNVCDSERYHIDLWTEENGWEDIKDWDDAPEIIPGNWNKLAIEVNRQHAKFYINNQLIHEADHELLDKGESGVFISKYDDQSAVFEFDNFILRWPSEEEYNEPQKLDHKLR